MYKSAMLDRPNYKKKPPPLIIKYQTNHFKSKNSSTQTTDYECEEHNKRITELLAEMAVTLTSKAKLEKELHLIKNSIEETQAKYKNQLKNLEEQQDRLKRDNCCKDQALSENKITHLEEQRQLLTQISELKSQVQNLTVENEKVQFDKNYLVGKINTEHEKNACLQIKVGKYKAKLKCVTTYIEKTMKTKNIRKHPEAGDRGYNNFEKPEEIQSEIVNFEEMILAELFFKPKPISQDVADIFFTE